MSQALGAGEDQAVTSTTLRNVESGRLDCAHISTDQPTTFRE
jgi:hypothetical protein